MPKAKYEPTTRAEVPDSIRFDVPGRFQGQIIEFAFGGSVRDRHEHDDGDPYMRITDYSLGPGDKDRVLYFKRAS